MVAELRGKPLVAIILLTSGVDFLLFGYDQGLFGGILAGKRFQKMLGNPNSTMSGLVTGIYCVGCAFGAVGSFVFGEKLGRKRSIIYANIIVIIATIIQTSSYSYAQMFVSRIIAGVGVGLSTVAVPILQAETLPAYNRGALLVVQSSLIVAGIAISSWICLGTLFADSDLQWRFPIACQIIFSSLVLVLSIWLPESPRWTAKKGDIEGARNLLSQVLNKPTDSEEVEGQLTEILEFIALEQKDGDASWGEVFRNNTKSYNLQRVLLGAGPYLMNQWSGINTLTYYLGYILQVYLNYSQTVSLVLAGVAFTQCAIVSTPPYFFIDRIGRRRTLIFSSASCAVCLAIVSGSLLDETYSGAAAAVAFMFLYLDCYVLGFLPISWSYSAEIQPLRVRNKATAVGVFTHWISNFVIVMITPIGIDNIGGNFFWIWAVICALFVPLVYVFGVETSGRTLEEVDQMFLDDRRIFMGLNPKHRTVIKKTAQDEENRRRDFAHHRLDRAAGSTLNEKNGSVAVGEGHGDGDEDSAMPAAVVAPGKEAASGEKA